jgi:hypothetical protein
MGGERDLVQLEAALQARWDDATAAVYADALIARNDPRGELLALDLHIARHGLTEELRVARRARVTAWLGERAWADAGLGLTTTAVTSEAEAVALLADPMAPYLRSLTVYDHASSLDAIVGTLADLPLGWLRRLVLRKDRRSAEIETATFKAFAAAAPRIEELVLHGRRVLALPAKLVPGLRRLRLIGATALAGGGALPQLQELDLALQDDATTFVPLRAIPKLVAQVQLSRFPALARLDLSRNEGPQTVFPFAAALDLRNVVELRTPALRTDDDLDTALAILAHHPQLEIRVARMYGYTPGASHARLHVPPPRAWPARTAIEARSGLLIVPIDLGDTYLSLTSIVEVLEERFDAMPAPAQAAWRALWSVLDDLPWADDYLDEEVRPFDAATLLLALDAVDDDDVACELYAKALAALPPGATVGIQRYWSG